MSKRSSPPQKPRSPRGGGGGGNSSSSNKRSRTTSSSSTSLPAAAFQVYVGEIGIPIGIIVNFINETMRKERFCQSIDNRNAVVNVLERSRNCCFRLEMATVELAEKVCYLNRIEFHHKLLRISRNRHYYAMVPPRYACWNDYHVATYGVNDPMIDVQIFAHCDHHNIDDDDNATYLVEFLNQKMKQYDLCRPQQKNAIKRSRPIAMRTILLEMESPELAEKICYLNNIPNDRDDTSVIRLQRPEDWSGLAPKYDSFLEFLRDRRSLAAQNEATIEILDDDDDDDVVVLYDNKEELALEAENKRLKAVLAALSKSTEKKQEEIKGLETEVTNVKDQLSSCDNEVATLQDESKNIKSQYIGLQTQLNAVHASWQEQAIDLAARNKEIEELKGKVADLQKHHTDKNAKRNMVAFKVQQQDDADHV
eukprot:scaffold596_cov87-Cylindrotheca_fusiformis.AAC.8